MNGRVRNTVCKAPHCATPPRGSYCALHRWRINNWQRFDEPESYRQKRITGIGYTYEYIHEWLRKSFGKANHCENPTCMGPSRRYEWAKLKDKPYALCRDNYWQLCKRCHILYDSSGKPNWNKGITKRLRNCEQCGAQFKYAKSSRRFCSNSCSAIFRTRHGALQKAWVTRKAKQREMMS